MSATLGSTTYTAVTWTAGDVITEAKLDNMVANDQAYDSHGAEGILLNNNKSLGFKKAASGNVNGLIINTSDVLELGELDTFVKRFAQYQDIVVATDGATVTFDLGDGNVQTVTLGGNRTLALSNGKVGQVFALIIKQDGTGTRVPTFFTTIKWAGGVAPTLTTTADKYDVFVFITISSGNYLGFVVGQNL